MSLDELIDYFIIIIIIIIIYFPSGTVIHYLTQFIRCYYIT